ncbi:MAG: T9SS type A sorting domain-containing protein [Cyclobacteriaceae bacterium]
MRSIILVLIVTLLGALNTFCFSQSLSGNWDTAGNWTPSGIPANDPSINASLGGNGTLNGGNVHTIGNINAGGRTLTIASGGTAGQLTLGSSTLFNGGTKKSLTYTSAGGKLTINNNGILEIWGDLVLANGFTLKLFGNAQLIIHGNLTDNGTGGAQIDTQGTSSISVTGSFSLTGGGGQITTGGTSTISAASCSCTGCGGSGCAGNVLPVTLLFFTGKVSKTDIELNWASASELNFDFFDVEKSSDGTNFYSIVKVKGNGTTTDRHDYSFNDEKPLIGKNYYRLKSVDFDGYTEYFNVVVVDFDGQKGFSVYPNPVQSVNEIKIELNFVPEYPLEVTLYNLSGRQLQRTMLTGSSASLPVQLSSGMYIIRFNSPEYNSVSKFLVHE